MPAASFFAGIGGVLPILSFYWGYEMKNMNLLCIQGMNCPGFVYYDGITVYGFGEFVSDLGGVGGDENDDAGPAPGSTNGHTHDARDGQPLVFMFPLYLLYCLVHEADSFGLLVAADG